MPSINGNSSHIYGNADVFGGKSFDVIAYSGAQYYNNGRGDELSHRQFGFSNKLIAVVPMGMTVSGTYYVLVQPYSTGLTRFYLRWFVTSTNQEVAAGVNLSAEILQLLGIGI